MIEVSIKGIAMQQIVYDGSYHICMICQKFMDKDVKLVEVHLINTHSRILALIAKEQEVEDD